MALRECENGHLYDPNQYQACPYCGNNMNMVEYGGSSNIGKTVGMGMSPEVGATVAPASYNMRDDGIGKTVGLLKKSMKIEPVVGWLVCIEGKDKGKDYRIEAKNNTIGRSESMDICISGDDTISRENHARLAYDVKHNAFHLVPAESTNSIYLNDEPVYIPTKLNEDDVIEFGESKFVFIPFCDDKFNWQDGISEK